MAKQTIASLAKKVQMLLDKNAKMANLLRGIDKEALSARVDVREETTPSTSNNDIRKGTASSAVKGRYYHREKFEEVQNSH